MKDGYKTTEFWLSLVAMLVGALIASGVLAEGGMPLQVAGMVAAALSAMGYSSSRAKAKQADSLGKPLAPEQGPAK